MRIFGILLPWLIWFQDGGYIILMGKINPHKNNMYLLGFVIKMAFYIILY